MRLLKNILAVSVIAIAVIFLSVFTYGVGVGALGLTINQGIWLASIVMSMIGFSVSYPYLKAWQQNASFNNYSDQDRLLQQGIPASITPSVFFPLSKLFCGKNTKQELIQKINKRREEYFKDELKYHEDITAIDKCRVDLIERRDADNVKLREERDRIKQSFMRSFADKVEGRQPSLLAKTIQEKQKEITQAQDKIADLVDLRDNITICTLENLSDLSVERLAIILNEVVYAICQRQDLHHEILQEKYDYMQLLEFAYESPRLYEQAPKKLFN